jgi:hypothetical protein
MGGFGGRQQQVKLPGPGDKRICRLLAFFLGPRAFEPVEHLVPNIDPRASLVLP